MPNKKQHQSSRIAALRTLFNKYDADGSGELDVKETQAMLWEMGLDASVSDVERVLNRADKDGNLCIGFDEFAAGCLDETDSNVYSGIPRRKDSGVDGASASMYLDMRRKRTMSMSVWTKDDIERSLMENSVSDPLVSGSADDPERRKYVEKKIEVDRAKKDLRELEKRVMEARERIQVLEKELAGLEKEQGAKDDVPILLSGVLKNCQTANEIAKVLKKDAVFNARIFKDTGSGENTIEVNLRTQHGSFFWNLDKFNERFAEMLNMQDDYKHCHSTGTTYVDDRPQDQDPFFDSEYQLIGVATAWLKSLGNMMESSVSSAILNSAGGREGEMEIVINPCDRLGGEGPWDDEDELDPFVDTPDELLGSDIHFRIRIPTATFLDKAGDGSNPYENLYLRYKVNLDDTKEIWSRSDKVTTTSLKTAFDYCEEHRLFVDEKFVKHLQEGRILFEIWGQVAAVHNQMRRKADALVAVSRMKAATRLTGGGGEVATDCSDAPATPSAEDEEKSLDAPPPHSARGGRRRVSFSGDIEVSQALVAAAEAPPDSPPPDVSGAKPKPSAPGEMSDSDS